MHGQGSMNLTPHFTLEECIQSDTASRLGINNQLPDELHDEMRKTCELLERIRLHLSQVAGKIIPVSISSGYRCLALNRAIGSKDTSDHIKGMAADIKAPDFGTPKQVAEALVPVMTKIGIGQMLYEFKDWVHVSTRVPEKAINRILTVTAAGYQIGIQET